MRLLVASDSYKGSLTTQEVLAAAREAASRFDSDIEVLGIPIADGGEGMLEAVLEAIHGTKISCEASDPLGRKIDACYGLVGNTAIIEMAISSGLTRLKKEERNPYYASSFGLGQVIHCALENPVVEKIIIGIGGSASNDGGVGMAQALGLRALDERGRDVKLGGFYVSDVRKLDSATLHPRLKSVPIRVMCDVENPLCGPEGASVVYGPQKGATSAMVAKLDLNLEHLADVIERDLGLSVSHIPGAGAAGGVGAGLVAFCGAKLEPGINVMLDLVDFDNLVQKSDLVLTGEGKTDFQTAFGKAVSGIARRVKPLKIPVVCLSGSLGTHYRDLYPLGVNSFFSICPGPISEEDAMTNAYSYAVNAIENILRLYQSGMGR